MRLLNAFSLFHLVVDDLIPCRLPKALRVLQKVLETLFATIIPRLLMMWTPATTAFGSGCLRL